MCLGNINKIIIIIWVFCKNRTGILNWLKTISEAHVSFSNRIPISPHLLYYQTLPYSVPLLLFASLESSFLVSTSRPTHVSSPYLVLVPFISSFMTLRVPNPNSLTYTSCVTNTKFFDFQLNKTPHMFNPHIYFTLDTVLPLFIEVIYSSFD